MVSATMNDGDAREKRRTSLKVVLIPLGKKKKKKESDLVHLRDGISQTDYCRKALADGLFCLFCLMGLVNSCLSAWCVSCTEQLRGFRALLNEDGQVPGGVYQFLL